MGRAVAVLAARGLRATWSRALLGLIAVVAAATALLWWFGLHDPDLSTAVLQAIEGATLRTGDRDAPTEAGSAVQLALRLLGPVLFGLALLSLRGRVKR